MGAQGMNVPVVNELPTRFDHLPEGSDEGVQAAARGSHQ
jgi:hypothetical protein